MLYRFYVGSNNKTKKLEYPKAVKIASTQFEGLTAFKGLGYWQGKPERMAIIEVETTNGQRVRRLAHTLAVQLHQQAVGLAIVGSMQFIK